MFAILPQTARNPRIWREYSRRGRRRGALPAQGSNRIFADSSLLAEPTVDVDAFNEYASETLTVGLGESGRAAHRNAGRKGSPNFGSKFGPLFRRAARIRAPAFALPKRAVERRGRSAMTEP